MYPLPNHTSSRRLKLLGSVSVTVLSLFAFAACDGATPVDLDPEASGALALDGGNDGSAASAQGTYADACDGTLGAIDVDDVEVPDGATCILDGTRVDGNVIVGDGATLDVIGAHIEGNIQAEDTHEVRTGQRTFVGGNIQVKRQAVVWIDDTVIDGDLQVEEGGASLVVYGTVIGGNLQFQKAASAIVEDSWIDGDLQMQENWDALAVLRTDVRGNLQVFKNTGGVTLVDNRIEQTLQCGENEPEPTGSGNLAGEKEGQCSEL